MSITVSSPGREQQIKTLPAAGASSGSGSYFTDPEINPLSQLWQTPVRHDQRTGTSQASASSSRLCSADERQRTTRPLRAKDTSGPVPGAPVGGCGGRDVAPAAPGMTAVPPEKISEWTRLEATPHAASPAVRSWMKLAGPQR